MGIFILAAIMLIAFAAYRVYLYKKQRKIEESAADAQAYISSEIVDLLQKIKSVILAQGGSISPELQNIQDQVKNQLENMYCPTDSEASVREYLSAAKQDLALIQVKLEKLITHPVIDEAASSNSSTAIENAFDSLK